MGLWEYDFESCDVIVDSFVIVDLFHMLNCTCLTWFILCKFGMLNHMYMNLMQVWDVKSYASLWILCKSVGGLYTNSYVNHVDTYASLYTKMWH